MKVSDNLHQLGDMFEKKNSDYGDAYKKVGELFHLLDPSVDPNKANIMNLFSILLGKIIRFHNLNFLDNAEHVNFESIEDTLDDISIYAQMIKELINPKEKL